MSAQADLALSDDNADLVEQIGDVDVPEHKWASTLAGMVDTFAAFYGRRGRNREDAVQEAQELVAVLAQDFGGRPVYLPRGDRLKQALVAREIYLLHNGRNVEQLADRFGYTVRHVQRVYAEQRALQIRKRQGRLFGEQGENP